MMADENTIETPDVVTDVAAEGGEAQGRRGRGRGGNRDGGNREVMGRPCRPVFSRFC